MRHLLHTLIVTALATVAASLDPAGLIETRAFAQTKVPAAPDGSAALDARWLAWMGCWRSDAERLVSDNARLCVIPAGTGNPHAVRLLVVVDDVIATEEVMTADGSPMPVNENGCNGDRHVSWSSRGTSRYSRMQLGCPVGPPLKATGLSLMTSGPLWLTVEVTQSYGREIVEVLKYSRASVPALLADVLTPELIANAGEASDTLAATPFDLRDVIEASTTVTPKAIEVALLETGTVLPVNRRTLIALDDADVPPTVIDLMVALAYPDKFVISRPTAATGWLTTFAEADDWADALFADYPYSSTFYIFYDGDGSGDSGGRPPARNDAAVAIKGKGYAQVRPAGEAVGPSNGTNGSNGARSASGSSNAGGDSASSSGDGSSSNASASSSGYTSGGGGDTGRSAVQRE